ncbi:MAG: hypothetical protein U0324_03505 [Polyangiales bacterium]
MPALLSQLPRPGAQDDPHAPPTQVATLPSGIGQDVRQLPQLSGPVSGVSQPLPGIPSQLPKPGAQARPQTPPEQVAVALAPVGHARSQRPQ